MCILYNLSMIMIHSSTYVSVLQMNGNGSNFVTIRMKPDAQGRFGFNVKVCRYLRVVLSLQSCLCGVVLDCIGSKRDDFI